MAKIYNLFISHSWSYGDAYERLRYPIVSTLPSSQRARDPDWELALLLTSVPLREIDKSLKPIGSASGCLVDCLSRRWLLTVEHATGNQGNWAIEEDYVDGRGARVHQLGPMEFLREFDASSPLGSARTVDLAYAKVPRHVKPVHLLVKDGRIVGRIPRRVIQSDLEASPVIGNRYGFAGQIHVDLSGYALRGGMQVETGLIYEGEVRGYDHYSLDHAHPGDAAYAGCSGAPILSTEGVFVGLVCGRPPGTELVRALPVRRYRVAIAIASQLSG